MSREIKVLVEDEFRGWDRQQQKSGSTGPSYGELLTAATAPAMSTVLDVTWGHSGTLMVFYRLQLKRGSFL